MLFPKEIVPFGFLSKVVLSNINGWSSWTGSVLKKLRNPLPPAAKLLGRYSKWFGVWTKQARGSAYPDFLCLLGHHDGVGESMCRYCHLKGQSTLNLLPPIKQNYRGDPAMAENVLVNLSSCMAQSVCLKNHHNSLDFFVAFHLPFQSLIHAYR